jgi:sulfonate transport system substrate-binding protein
MSTNHRAGLRLLASIAGLAALGLTFAGCGSSSSASSPSTTAAAATVSASSAAPLPDLSGVTLKVGQTGYAQAQLALQVAGLDNTPYKVSWAVFTGGDKQMQALQAGALDIGNASEIPPVFAAANTTPKWKAVITEKANTLLQEVDVAKGSSITSIAQLKGKKVGYVQNTTAQYFLLKLLQQAGLQWSDITPAPLLPADGVAALNGGSIAAFANYGNSVITILQGGGKTIGSGQDILSGNFVYALSDSALASQTQSVASADLFARINQAYDDIRNSPTETTAYAQKVADATHESLALAQSQFVNGEQEAKTSFLAAAPAAITSEQQVADAFTLLGAIPKVDVSSFWSTALNSDYTAALARYPVTGGTAGLAAAPSS